MSIKYVPWLLVCALLATSCGGGGSGGRRVTTAPLTSGGFTLLVGDAALDGVAAVNIDIEEVVLIGAGGQLELATNDIDEINLLDLRNVTELVVATDVPSRSYNKIRLFINSLTIVEDDGDMVAAQLPANGKIDLNPQGPFEISANEDVVVQIDFDLERSIQLVQTGNSQYRFRPVVFVDVIDQTDNLRLTKLFGTLEDDASTGAVLDFDLCDVDDPATCFDVTSDENALLLQVDGMMSTDLANLPRGAEATVFGHFFVGVEGGTFFRAMVVAMGPEDSVVNIDGEVASLLEDSAFDILREAGGPATTVQLVDDAKLLDALGAPLANDPVIGQAAEAWAQTALLDLAAADEFPAFLVQIRDAIDEDSVAGRLVSIEGDQLTLQDDEGELCVLVAAGTDFQLITSYNDDAELEDVTLAELSELLAGTAELDVEAFGTQGAECLTATVVVAESL